MLHVQMAPCLSTHGKETGAIIVAVKASIAGLDM